MCGFIGGTDPEWDYAAGLESIVHRGPDAGALDLEGRVKVGFRRLAIIDLDESANQPMFARDGASWIVFNGEIYGFRRVRRELEQRGHAFRTESDTEVALTAYLEWGERFVERIEGMFAIALWDAGAHKLKLFRDRPGIKPLYYFYDGRRFGFASELKALEAACEASDLAVDGTALYDFLGYRYVPAPKTMYQHCFKLEPAHLIVFDAASGKLGAPRRYWGVEIPDAPRRPEPDAAAEELRGLIEASVDDQMIADVPLGFFLSGGVDSSTVVASAARHGRRMSTFSIGFDTDRVSETPHAREVAALFDTDHEERILSRGDAHELLPKLKHWFDEPFADQSAMPTWLVARTAQGQGRRAGAAAIAPRFMRYARPPSWPALCDRASYRLRRGLGARNPLARILALLEMRLSTGPRLWAKIMAGMPEAAKTGFRRELEIPADYDDWWHYRAHWRPELPARTRLQYLDFHTFMPGLVLTKVDRTTMAVSLEARVPLLDRRIIEFSFALDEDVRYLGDELKGLFRHAYRGILPDAILNRRKKGFGIPRYYFRELEHGPIQEHVLRALFLPAAGARAA